MGALSLSLTRSSHCPKLSAHCHCLRPGTQVLVVSSELRFPSCPFYHNTSCNHHHYPLRYLPISRVLTSTTLARIFIPFRRCFLSVKQPRNPHQNGCRGVSLPRKAC